MKCVSIALLALSFPLSLGAAEYTRAMDIIQKEGEFLFTDGSSYFLFMKDGTFDSGPVSESGRTIHGKWKQDGDYRFIVEGKWSWLNGVSGLDDNRRLTITAQPPFIEQAPTSGRSLLPRKVPPKVYKCYSTVEGLVKVEKEKVK